MKIFPSLISSDLLHLADVLKNFDSHCDGYHIDVMDDHFVPNLTWGPAFATAIRQATSLPIHLHLMVDNVEAWYKRVPPIGMDIPLKADDTFIFHWEVMQEIPVLDCKIGVALNPGTPVEEILPHLERIDHVLLMSVEPGFSGQVFMPVVVEKVAPLVAARTERNLSFSIGMDGGVGEKNISMLVREGVDMVGVASAIFSAPRPLDAIKKLYELCKK